jgi:hypothetical protein
MRNLREGHKLKVYENRVLRRIFGPKREEVVGGWRRLHNEELHNLYTSQNIIRLFKCRRMSCATHAKRIGGTDLSEDLGLNGRITEWKLRK